MFSAISNGSKIALSCLVNYVKQFGFQMIDCQVENSHLLSLGAINISRKLYLDLLSTNNALQVDSTAWSAKTLNWQKLLRMNCKVA